MLGIPIEMLDEHDHGRPYFRCECGEMFLLVDAPPEVEVECKLTAVDDEPAATRSEVDA